MVVEHIRRVGNKTEVAYQHTEKRQVVASSHAPLTDRFEDYWRQVVPHALRIAGITVAAVSEVALRKITLKRKEDRVGVVLTCVKKCSGGGVITFNTPLRYAPLDGGAQEYSENLDELLEGLIEEIEAWEERQWKQLDMFGDGVSEMAALV